MRIPSDLPDNSKVTKKFLQQFCLWTQKSVPADWFLSALVRGKMQTVPALPRRARDKHLQNTHTGFSGVALSTETKKGCSCLHSESCPATSNFLQQKEDVVHMAVTWKHWGLAAIHLGRELAAILLGRELAAIHPGRKDPLPLCLFYQHSACLYKQNLGSCHHLIRITALQDARSKAID